MNLQGIRRVDLIAAPRHGVRFDRPDIVREPLRYVQWLLDPEGPVQQRGDLHPLELPMVEDVYTIGPKAAPVDRQWLVVVTEPQRERVVADELTRDGIETYVPVRKAFSRAMGGRRRTLTRALLPGYAFAAPAEVAGAISVIMDADSARSVLPHPDAPRTVPGEEIERLRRLEDAGEFDETQIGRKGWDKANPTGTLAWIRKGAQIWVTDGPFATFPGIVERVDAGRRRVMAALAIFGQETPVELEYTQFRRA